MSTYGFIGSGDTTAKNTTALLDDLIDAEEEPATFIIPVTQSLWTTPIQTIADYAFDQEIPYEVVTDDSADSHKAFAEIIQAATKVHRVQRVAMKIENILEKSAEPVLIVAWSDEDADSLSALERALTRDIPAFDLCNGLEPLEFDDESDDDTEPEAHAYGLPDDATGEPEEEDLATGFDPNDIKDWTDEVLGRTGRPAVLEDDEMSDEDIEFDEPIISEEDNYESSPEDDESQEDTLSTTHAERTVAFPMATPHAAHPEDFESTYSLDLDTDLVLSKAMDILCDRIAARVLAIMAPRMDALERTVRNMGGTITAPQAAPAPKAETKTAPRSRTAAPQRPAPRTAPKAEVATEKAAPARKPRQAAAQPAAEEGKRRPGRPKLPRDENGNIIR